MALMMSAAGMHHYPNCISFASADSRPQRLKICTVERLKLEFGSGQLGNVLDGLNAMSDGIDSGIYASLIQECIKTKDLSTGMRIHEQIVQRGMEGNVYLGNLLLSLYGKCGSLDKALQTFNAMPCRNVVSWSAMISAYGKHGQPKKAVGLLNEMECEGLKPNRITMITVLNALSTPELLNSGKLIHACIINSGFQSDIVVENTLIKMYGDCCSVENARTVFERMEHQNIVSWTAIIGAYADHGHGQEAFQLFHKMQEEDMKPNIVTFVAILNACSLSTSLDAGKQIHDIINASGLQRNTVLENAIMNMYSKCGSLEHASKIFNKMEERNLVSWNTMLAAYVRTGLWNEGIALFYLMKHENVVYDKYTLVTVCGACEDPAFFAHGKLIHACVNKEGLELDGIVGKALINMYGKCGNVEQAYRLFNQAPHKDASLWTLMISTYVQHKNREDAFKVFDQMQQQGIQPDKFAHTTILSACLTSIGQGKKIHAEVVAYGMEAPIAETALLSMYSKAGYLTGSTQLFDRMHQRDVISWTAIVGAHVFHGYEKEIFKLVHEMQQKGIKPDSVTFITILGGCTNLSMLPQSKLVHAHSIAGQELDSVVASALIIMYGKCGWPHDAQVVFKQYHETLDLCNSMVETYVRWSYWKEALHLFQQMQQNGLQPDKFCLTLILNVFGSLAALAEIKMIHARMLDGGYDAEVIVGTSLVTAYGRCGSINHARMVFDNMDNQNLLSWSAMIGLYSQHGCGKEAIQLVGHMQQAGLEIDSVTFISILTACNLFDLIDVGCHYFVSSRNYHINLMIEHYGCMVELLGREGQLDEAESLITDMPLEPDSILLTGLLGACKIHGDLDRAQHVAKCIQKLDPLDGAAYIMLCNVYAAAGNASQVRSLMEKKAIDNKEGHSFITLNNALYEFSTSDGVYPEIEKVYAQLESLKIEIKKAGYAPDISDVVYELEEDKKEELLWNHSEKLAIAFGIISTPSHTPLKVIKHLSICVDCHAVSKYISNVYEREIVLRDDDSFHHIINGVCSCEDYFV